MLTTYRNRNSCVFGCSFMVLCFPLHFEIQPLHTSHWLIWVFRWLIHYDINHQKMTSRVSRALFLREQVLFSISVMMSCCWSVCSVKVPELSGARANSSSFNSKPVLFSSPEPLIETPCGACCREEVLIRSYFSHLRDFLWTPGDKKTYVDMKLPGQFSLSVSLKSESRLLHKKQKRQVVILFARWLHTIFNMQRRQCYLHQLHIYLSIIIIWCWVQCDSEWNE